MLYIKEPDGTFAIYDERGILKKHFATRQEAQAWIDYRNREDAASREIAARARVRARESIAQWAAEAAAEFNLGLEDVLLDIQWAVEDVLEEMFPE
jgi:hypothetical protein